MLSLSSILNPAPPGPGSATGLRLSPASSSPTSTSSLAEEALLNQHLSSMVPHKMPKQPNGFAKSSAKGTVNFYPYESLDSVAMREVRKYQVYPLGKIQEYCRHIPYNSGKKDFYEKTGRESFEVFQYIFKAPGDDTEYLAMWDYNVGLVRMTPFFKCCKYSKTTPAKMLNLNPGLRDITHSITGGSIMAQGYWMPFACAKAVCATFCYHIAGALIPIFGPKFPSECIGPDAPGYGRMIIDSDIIAASTHEAEMYRRMFLVHSNSLPPTPSLHHSRPLLPHHMHSVFHTYTHPRLHIDHRGQHHGKGHPGIRSPYGSDTEEGDENSPMPVSSRHMPPQALRMRENMMVAGGSPVRSTSDWTAADSNYQDNSQLSRAQRRFYSNESLLYNSQAPPNPLLSAVPRAPAFEQQHGFRVDQGLESTASSYHALAPPHTKQYQKAPSHDRHPAQTMRAVHHQPRPEDGANPGSPQCMVSVSSFTDPKRVALPKKRSAGHIDDVRDDKCDVGSGQRGLGTLEAMPVSALPPANKHDGLSGVSGAVALASAALSHAEAKANGTTASRVANGAEKNAALLLMHLSVQDTDRRGQCDELAEQGRKKEECGHARVTSLGERSHGHSGSAYEVASLSGPSIPSSVAVEGQHRRKRRRAASM